MSEKAIENPWRRAFGRVFKPRPRLSGSAWADAYRYVPPGTSPEPGPWRTDRVPYLREPLDIATDVKTEHVVLMLSSQLGKSELLLCLLGYYADQEPSPILMLQPTLGMAEAFSKERVDPMFRWSAGLKDKLEKAADPRRGTSRKSGDTILMKNFPGGYLAMVGANSPAGLASRPVRILLADEVDRYGATKEGDPLKLAMQRTTNFHNRKIIMVSTPTISGLSQIEAWFNRSDQREYKIPCPGCGVCEAWNWPMVRWDRNEIGLADPRSARIECPHCGHVLRGPGRPDPELISRGFWEAQADSAEGIKGYHLNSLVSPWVNLDALVAEFTQATYARDKAGLQEFINLKMGEPFDDMATTDDLGAKVWRRREYYKSEVPEGVCVLTAGVDVQRDRLEVSIIGWGPGHESWVVQHSVILGDPLQPAPWAELDDVLGAQYEHPIFGPMAVVCSCVDSGDGYSTDRVYLYTKAREARRVFSVKGRGGFDLAFVSKPTRAGRCKAALFSIGVDAGKTIVASRLALEDEGPGFVHIPRDAERGCGEEYCLQLGAERLKQKYERGKMVRRWVKARDRNEALDCMVYATAAVEILGVDLDELDRRMRKAGGAAMRPRPKKRAYSRGVY